MKQVKSFLDTHDQRSNTFPVGISTEQFAEFFAKYEKACRHEGVVVLRAHVGIEAGRAYCFNMAEVSQVGIASELGSAREVVFRALRSLAGRKLVQTGRMKIRITDRQGLAVIAADEGSRVRRAGQGTVARR